MFKRLTPNDLIFHRSRWRNRPPTGFDVFNSHNGTHLNYAGRNRRIDFLGGVLYLVRALIKLL